ncbi:MAG: DUF2628 domain-containing protein [Hyphomicrobiales bacterium]
MRSYTVHRRQPLPGAPLADGQWAEAEGLVFVREGLCWPALVIPALWLIYRRLWLVLLGYIAITALTAPLAAASGLDGTGVIITLAAVQALLAAQAYDLWRWTLSRRGYDMIGLATGRNIVEAEMQFFQAWLAQPAGGDTPRPATPASIIPHTLPAPVAGLFDAQGPN